MKRECSRCGNLFEKGTGKFRKLCDSCLFKQRHLRANSKLKAIMRVIDDYEKLYARDINEDLRKPIYKIFEKC